MTWSATDIAARQRVITDNDYGGDTDGLVQLAHLLLSPSVSVPFVISSHLGASDPFGVGNEGSAARGARAAAHIAELCGRSDVTVIAGSERGLVSRTEPVDSPAARAIVAEAMRDDDVPLFVTAGGSLTEIASAWLLEPRIAQRLTVVWIGGREHEGLAEVPPGAGDLEYNTGLDLTAAQVVFDDSDLVVWQVPRSTYRMVIASRAELLRRLAPAGVLGRFLYDELARVVAMATSHGWTLGETYVLGDSPLVSLTALWTAFEPGPASSASIMMPCPRLTDSGRYEARPDGRPLRIFTGIDQRLLLEDLYCKLALHADGVH